MNIPKSGTLKAWKIIKQVENTRGTKTEKKKHPWLEKKGYKCRPQLQALKP